MFFFLLKDRLTIVKRTGTRFPDMVRVRAVDQVEPFLQGHAAGEAGLALDHGGRGLLGIADLSAGYDRVAFDAAEIERRALVGFDDLAVRPDGGAAEKLRHGLSLSDRALEPEQIGRAACRERVFQYV